MIVIGLIGPIGAGKTYVLNLLSQLGAATIKADDLSRQLQKPGTGVMQLLREEFGGEYFDSEGALLRKKLAGLIFRDETARRQLNAIMYPAMIELLKAKLEKLRASNLPPDMVVIEAANLIEMGAEPLVKYFLSVTAPKELRCQRLRERDGITLSAAEERIQSQAAAGLEKIQADFEISTDVKEGALRHDVECFYRRLTSTNT